MSAAFLFVWRMSRKGGVERGRRAGERERMSDEEKVKDIIVYEALSY
jgi:hypothetical protein